ncbi:hypothetical protein PTTG_27942 [Puccinia triticina 1-1 BBBD Race 1]|uniref:Retrotransposon gag domain-containing protein n=1 Tax=Puccinia triticina (isolate 1-1 / race 1 (BBBD)) TaxID=630390 RepID=A0A180GFS9_PUCT1|nr:hypothetical protein PTTG_27942 [Puccinia triticina 1-1 BBBD Race 1]
MSTRRTTAPEDLLPITDPDAIIRAANAEKGRQKQLEASTHSDSTPARRPRAALSGRPPSPFALHHPRSHRLASIPHNPRPVILSPQPLRPRGRSRGKPPPPPDYMKMLIDAQLALVEQARKDRYAAREEREANAKRMARMEEATLALIELVRQTPAPPAPITRSAEAELPRIRTSDAPHYTGPAQAVEPFLKWIHGVQVFFATKAIKSNVNKIRVVGSLIDETNLLLVYANEVDSYVGKPWQEFKDRLFKVAITPDWREELHERIVQLKMLDSEDFMSYSIRAQTLQRMINFDKPPQKIQQHWAT